MEFCESIRQATDSIYHNQKGYLTSAQTSPSPSVKISNATHNQNSSLPLDRPCSVISLAHFILRFTFVSSF